MTAAFAPTGNMVACGGMDNQLTLYDLNNRDTNGVAKLIREISGYEVRFKRNKLRQFVYKQRKNRQQWRKMWTLGMTQVYNNNNCAAMSTE